MEPQKPAYKRRILFINKSVQLKILGYATLCSVLSSAFTMFAVTITQHYTELGQAVPPIKSALILGGGTIVFTCMLMGGLYLTNRIVGPLYRLHRFINDVIAGKKLPPIRLREDDEWMELIADFNTFSAKLASLPKDEKK